MTKLPPTVFSVRPVEVHELPVIHNKRLLHPDRTMLKVGNNVHDVGAYCYALRSNRKRKQGGAREVVMTSFRRERVSQIRQVIHCLSIFCRDGGKSPRSLSSLLDVFKVFMDWADTNGCPNCLSGGEATRTAYQLFAKDVEDRYQRHEFESAYGARLQISVLKILEAVTGLTDLGKGTRFVRDKSWRNGGTEPATEHNFAHTLALNESLFQGLCDLILGNQPFPFQLTMPKSLGWEHDFLWLFPTSRWFLHPHQRGETREHLGTPHWNYNYEHGRIATVEELISKYSGPQQERLDRARHVVKRTEGNLEDANSDSNNHFRRMLAVTAHNAFYTLFLANTAGNAAPAADIETDGIVDETTANPGFRTIKWRALGKDVRLVVPVAFVPALRRFMELRRFLLAGKAFPYLFLSLGDGKRDALAQVHPRVLASHYNLLRRIDLQLPKMGARKIRATASNYYKQRHDADIESAVLQHSKDTAQRAYEAGTESGQHVELTLLMEMIAQKAQQQIVSKGTAIIDTRPLEEGGACQSYGEPEAMADDVPVRPNCRTGCLFCTKRILIAGEEDTRKVASAAFLMEQLIMGPMSEAEFRPQISKCDDDLARIRTFDGCREMVDRVKKDVYENGNLTPYFADKYQLFLTLGVI